MRADEYQKQQEEHEQWERAKKAQKQLEQLMSEIKNERDNQQAKKTIRSSSN